MKKIDIKNYRIPHIGVQPRECTRVCGCGRKSTIIPGVKRQVQPLISEVAKKMRMSSNLAKRKRPEDEPAHPEDDWHVRVQ